MLICRCTAWVPPGALRVVPILRGSGRWNIHGFGPCVQHCALCAVTLSLPCPGFSGERCCSSQRCNCSIYGQSNTDLSLLPDGFQKHSLCVSAAFLGEKKEKKKRNCCILGSLGIYICILIKNTYSVFLNVGKGVRENRAARGRKSPILSIVKVYSLWMFCSHWIFPEPRAKRWVTCSPACVPLFMYMCVH